MATPSVIPRTFESSASSGIQFRKRVVFDKYLLGFLSNRDSFNATRYFDEDEKLLHSMCVSGQNREIL